MSVALSALALAVSLASLVVSILGHRASGPRVEIARHAFTVQDTELWLELRVANVGRGEINIDGATCDRLGSTTNALPFRLLAAASHPLHFRTPLTAALLGIGNVTVNVGLGTGRTLTKQLRLSDEQQALIRQATTSFASAGTVWYPRVQEEL